MGPQGRREAPRTSGACVGKASAAEQGTHGRTEAERAWEVDERESPARGTSARRPRSEDPSSDPPSSRQRWWSTRAATDSCRPLMVASLHRALHRRLDHGARGGNLRAASRAPRTLGSGTDAWRLPGRAACATSDRRGVVRGRVVHVALERPLHGHGHADLYSLVPPSTSSWTAPRSSRSGRGRRRRRRRSGGPSGAVARTRRRS